MHTHRYRYFICFEWNEECGPLTVKFREESERVTCQKSMRNLWNVRAFSHHVYILSRCQFIHSKNRLDLKPEFSSLSIAVSRRRWMVSYFMIYYTYSNRCAVSRAIFTQTMICRLKFITLFVMWFKSKIYGFFFFSPHFLSHGRRMCYF